MGSNSESNKNNALHNPKQLIMKEKIKKEKIFPRPANQQGSILAFSLIIMFVLMIIAIGVATVSVKERKMSSDTGKSIIAYQAADSGMEKTLQAIVNDASIVDLDDVASSIGGEASCTGGEINEIITLGNYSILFYDNADNLLEDCTDSAGIVNRIKSSGSYSGTNRAVEVSL